MKLRNDEKGEEKIAMKIIFASVKKRYKIILKEFSAFFGESLWRKEKLKTQKYAGEWRGKSSHFFFMQNFWKEILWRDRRETLKYSRNFSSFPSKLWKSKLKFIISTVTTIAWLSYGLYRPPQQWLRLSWIRNSRKIGGRTRRTWRPTFPSSSASKRCRRSGTKSSLRWNCHNVHDWSAFTKKWVILISGSVSPGERKRTKFDTQQGETRAAIDGIISLDRKLWNTMQSCRVAGLFFLGCNLRKVFDIFWGCHMKLKNCLKFCSKFSIFLKWFL